MISLAIETSIYMRFPSQPLDSRCQEHAEPGPQQGVTYAEVLKSWRLTHLSLQNPGHRKRHGTSSLFRLWTIVVGRKSSKVLSAIGLSREGDERLSPGAAGFDEEFWSWHLLGPKHLDESTALG